MVDVNTRAPAPTSDIPAPAPPHAPTVPGVRLGNAQTVAGLIVTGAALLGLWQLITVSGMVSPLLLPTPRETSIELWALTSDLFTGGTVQAAAWVTTQEILIGFALAVVIGFSLGVLVGETVVGQRIFLPYIVAINTTPKVAFAPLFIAWFGFGIFSKVMLAAFVATFPVIVDTAAGIHATDPAQLRLFESFRASRWRTLIKLKLPTALPHVFAGLKTASVLAVVGAIVGEFLGGGSGMGEMLRVAAGQLRLERVFALILLLSLLGLTVFIVIGRLERRIVFWRHTI